MRAAVFFAESSAKGMYVYADVYIEKSDLPLSFFFFFFSVKEGKKKKKSPAGKLRARAAHSSFFLSFTIQY